MIGQRLAGDGEAAHVGDAVGADAQVEEAGGAELAHERAAFGVDVVAVVGRRGWRSPTRSSSAARSRWRGS